MLHDHVKEGVMERACSTNREMGNAHVEYVGKPEGKRTPGKLRRM
jgi:hypothetical protein